MRVEVRYFASLVDRTGVETERVELDPGAGVAELWALLVARHPALGAIGYRPLVACDLEYARWDRTLDDVREVAFLPPVSGG